MGHARAYITFDVVRRILEDYFGYEIFYVMNITDIDDKIILRARQRHLLKEYMADASTTLELLLADSKEAYALAVSKGEASIAKAEEELKNALPEHKDAAVTSVDESKQKLQNVFAAQTKSEELLKALQENKANSDADIKAKIGDANKDVLWPLLDKRKGSTVNDQSIFREHARYYENEFLEDMETLGVRAPSVLTRVTEYVDEVIEYVKKIVDRGYAYESNGSVYFDVAAYDKTHLYAKLHPAQRNNKALAAEGEGALGTNSSDKRHDNDFALWKTSKPGEPSWESPWGHGRPGWHIECSVMASHLLGSNFDIHSGGIDLKFPHHDNELAQAEAHFECQQWVNYFLHAGHLHIDGLKMSKSLKNFITIRQVAAAYGPRLIRFLFLMQAWDRPMNYSDTSLMEAQKKDKQFSEFFANVKARIRKCGVLADVDQKWDQQEIDLDQALAETEARVHQSLLNNLSFADAVLALSALVNTTNVYLQETIDKPSRALLLARIARYVHRILGVFGITGSDDFGMTAGSGGDGGSRETTLAPVLDAMAEFRDRIRAIARESKNSDILAECDKIRDDILPELGVRLEDIAGQPSVWKLCDVEELRRERRAALRNELENNVRKLTLQRNKVQDELKRLVSQPFSELHADSYSQFNDKGLPTHDKDGEPLSKGATKKGKKLFDKHAKAYKKHLKNLETNPNYIADMHTKVDELSAAVETAQQEADALEE
jgi:cysteinyl-tRNA synthetase